jgi:hypothetical protein
MSTIARNLAFWAKNDRKRPAAELSNTPNKKQIMEDEQDEEMAS